MRQFFDDSGNVWAVQSFYQIGWPAAAPGGYLFLLEPNTDFLEGA